MRPLPSQSYSIPEGRVRLTDTIIERLPFTEEGQPQYFVKDSIIRNLWIIVGRRTKSAALVTYTNGKQRYETLGQWPTLPFKEMRVNPGDKVGHGSGRML